MHRAPSLPLIALTVLLLTGCTAGGAPGDAAAGSPSASASTGSAVATPSESESRSAGVQPCATADLKVSLGKQGGAADRASYPLRLTNTGDTCTVRGYGVAAFVSGDPGTLIGPPAKEVERRSVRKVVLRKGDRAVATLREADAGDFPRRTCRPTLARGLRVAPPDANESVYVPRSTTACLSEEVQQLSVTPYRPAR